MLPYRRRTGKMHVFEDKTPVFTIQLLNKNSTFPQLGILPVKILEKWKDADGWEIITITTERKWAVNFKEGIYEFELLKSS